MINVLTLLLLALPAEDGFSNVSTVQLIARARSSLKTLGPYQARLLKQERINGTLQASQTILLFIREKPLAVRAEYLEGPANGRRVLYDAQVRGSELLVRERGVLSVLGSIWISLSSSLARRDTNYAMTDVGIARLLDQLERQQNDVARHDEGWDAERNWCIRFTREEQVSRVCFDTERGLPVRVERSDRAGLFERFEWSAFVRLETTPDDPFSRRAAGM